MKVGQPTQLAIPAERDRSFDEAERARSSSLAGWETEHGCHATLIYDTLIIDQNSDIRLHSHSGGAGEKSLLGLGNTVPRVPTGGAGANTVHCQVRLGLVRLG